MKTLTTVSAAIFLPWFAVVAHASDRITPLEAMHIAEIHTARAVGDWSLADVDGESHYIVDVPMAEGETRRLAIHAGHGRVAKIESIQNGEAETTYQWPGIKVVAHRGGVGLGVPENTLPAIERAIEVGAQLIEIDIRETKDGHLVLMHDSTVDRTTDGSGAVNRMTLEEIRQLDAGSWLGPEFAGTRVPTLEEALEAMKGRIDPDLDFKAGDLQKLADIVNTVGVADQSTHCGSWDRCGIVQRIEPRIFIRPTINGAHEIPGLVRLLRPPLINMDWRAVTEESIRHAHVFGAKAFINCLETADTLLYAEMAARAGADYIQTDFPDRLIEKLREIGLMYDPGKDTGGRFNPLANPELGYPLW